MSEKQVQNRQKMLMSRKIQDLGKKRLGGEIGTDEGPKKGEIPFHRVDKGVMRPQLQSPASLFQKSLSTVAKALGKAKAKAKGVGTHPPLEFPKLVE